MPSFGTRSRKQLATCHPYLREVLENAIQHLDFTIIEGYRSEEDQNEAVARGASTVRYPNSKHNRVATQEDVDAGFAPNVGAPLSRAVDVAMWHPDDPHIDWNARGEFYHLAGILRGISLTILPPGWEVRCGADWDQDGYTNDQSFHDLPHVELIET